MFPLPFVPLCPFSPYQFLRVLLEYLSTNQFGVKFRDCTRCSGQNPLPTVAVAPDFAQRLLCGHHIAGNRLKKEFPTAGGCSNQTFLLMVPQGDKLRAISRIN